MYFLAKTKKMNINEYGAPPETLDGHPFYGADLDEQQLALANAIWSDKYDIVFCNSVAGTGKTFIALGVANMLVKYGFYDEIIYLMAPTQEQKIGYRPGTTEEKLAPYFMPLYDAARALGINPYTDINVCTDNWDNLGGGYITCMSPIFLRGRNIPATPGVRTILISDECQNMYIDEIQTVLTRVNDGAKVIMVGHTGQCDLLHHPERSGFAPYIELFSDEPRAAMFTLNQNHRGWISRKADTIQEFLSTKKANR